MLIPQPILRLFESATGSDDDAFRLPKLGAGRPTGHFRQFAASRRLQRSGAWLPGSRSLARRFSGGIVPHAGENIP
ncbi:hypothetical protein [Pseudoxanthomonas broegbernensis]|uniref:hypothetical protein n=1 Tax=Pseudoxanthomonas broegbernensis TaxID=83619 RepID=UPI001390F41F|nr:hypothetical protein [Pseudoxanthomonas broegbernensis]MBB6064835.1 hypothetical protein [Pseudoxanthomonas broegbernensis]